MEDRYDEPESEREAGRSIVTPVGMLDDRPAVQEDLAMEGGGCEIRAKAGGPTRGLAVLLVLIALMLLASVVANLAPASLSGTPTGRPAGAAGGVGALLEPSLLTTTAASGVPQGDWPTFLGSPERTSASGVPGIFAGVDEWAECPSATEIRAGPVANQTELWAATALGTVYAFDTLANGSVVWTTNLSTLPTELDLAGSTLLMGDSLGNLYALSAASGTALWTVNLGSAIAQAPLDLNGTAYVATTAGHVVALNVTTGAILWTVSASGMISGALAEQSNSLYAVTTSGELTAWTVNGTVEWTVKIPGVVYAAPSIGSGQAVVGTENGTVWAVSLSGGHGILWNWTAPIANTTTRAITSTPAQGDGLVVVQPQSGSVYALDASNGSVVWFSGLPEYGAISQTGPAISSGVVYAVNEGDGVFDGLSATTGALLWSIGLASGAFDVTSPAITALGAYVGTSDGCVLAVGSKVPVVYWPVSGTVTNASGAPLGGVSVVAGIASTVTAPNGTFAFQVPNGTTRLVFTYAGYSTVTRQLVVTGPVAGILVVLVPEARFTMAGTVVNAFTGAAAAGQPIVVTSTIGLVATTNTSAAGAFLVSVVNGTYNVSANGSALYELTWEYVIVQGANVSGIRLAAVPAQSAYPSLDPARLVAWAPLGLAGIAVLGVYLHELRRRRLEVGESGRILSPFGRYVLMRSLLVPAQASFLIAVIYLFDVLLTTPAGTLTLGQVLYGYGVLWYDLFSGQWGTYTFGGLTAPTSQFFLWWLGPSLELAVIAVALAATIAYPLGILAGAGRSRMLDGSVRVGATVVLLIPAFLAALLLFLIFGQTFYHGLGDLPFALLPTANWFVIHQGGYPSWIGPAVNTSPTTIPIVDSLIHGGGPVFVISLAKALLQAFIIALIFSAIYLRYVRAVVVDAAGEPHLRAARARGVPESTIVWRYLGRRALPFYILAFALTLPIYVGVQAVVEFVFMDQAVGSLILLGLTNYAAAPFGEVSLFQVSLFLVILVVLIAVLASDILARYLDPRLLRDGR